MSAFAGLVTEELTKARRKRGPIRSWHEGESVLREEFDEAVAEVRRQHRRPDLLLKELVQVAAMCQRMAEDTGLVEG
jgi:hypothetical protein